MDIKSKILRIKKVHSIISSILFILLLMFCINDANELNISEISLSRFGIYPKTFWVWNTGLFILGIILYVHSLKHIVKYYKDINNPVSTMFTLSTISLLLTASINMSYSIHNWTAVSYFLGYVISIFLFGFNLLQRDFRIGITSICIAIISVLFPLLGLYFFKGLAIPEIIHTLCIFLWIIVLTFDSEYKSFLKRFGF